MITEAECGDLGQIWKPAREAHLINQPQTYLDVAAALELRGGVRYVVSTQRGAQRLIQRFGVEFPDAMSSRQLWVDWVPWQPK